MLRTLIVEDNAIFRHSLRELLGARFPLMSIEEAGDGEEALLKMASFDPDIVFMDIRLPGKSGLEVSKKIRKTDWSGIIIVLTSHELPEYKAAARSCGANYFLTKGKTTGNEIALLVDSVISNGKNAHISACESGNNGS